MTKYYIKELKVENFKSFGDPVSFVFGPSTNAVFDRNGADESNFVEALGLALCDPKSIAKENGLRAQRLANEPEGYVTITIGKDADYSVNHTFSRIISGNSCEFRCNDVTVYGEEYEQALKAWGMHAASKLLMLPQRRAQEIANMSPKQLSKFLEEVCYDSTELIKLYEGAKEEAAKAQQEFCRASRKRKYHETDFENAKIEYSQWKKCTELRKKHDNMKIQSNLFHFYHDARFLAKLENELATAKTDLELRWNNLVPLKEQKRDKIIMIGKINNELIETRLNSIKLNFENHDVRNKIEFKTKKREQLQASLAECDVNKLEELMKDLKVTETRREELQRNLLPQNKKRLAEYDGIKARAMRLSNRHLEALARRNQKKLSLEMKLIHLNAHLQGDYEDERTAFVMRFEKQQQERRDELRKEIETKKRKIQEINLKLEEAEKANAELVEVKKGIKTKSVDLFTRRIDKIAAEESVGIVKALKENFQTVYGRLRDVCQAKGKKYEYAVNAVLFDNRDVIIVDTEETKRNCIAFLKQNKLPAQTFWPLDTIPVPPVAAPLRHLELPENVEYLVDKIKYEPEALKNAILHAFKNVLVCKTIADIESRASLGLTPGKNVKVVTLDGIYYRGKYFRSFGKIDLKKQAKRLDEAAIKILEQDLENLKTHKKEIKSKTLKESEMFWLKHDVENLQSQIKLNEFVLPCVRSLDPNIVNNAKIMKDVRKHRAAKATAEKDLDIVNGEIAKFENEIQALAEGVGLWNDFCRRFGYRNIQEFEEECKKKKDEADARHKQEMTLDNAIEDIKREIAHEESKNLLTKREQLAKDLRRCEKDLDKLRALQPIAEKKYTEVLKKLKNIQKQLELQTSEMKNLNATIDTFYNDEVKFHGIKLEIKRIRSQRHFLLLNCKENFIEMPIVNGDLGQVNILENDYSVEDRFAFDFDSLPQNLKMMTLDKDLKKEEDIFKRKLEKMQKCLKGSAQKLSPADDEELNTSTKEGATKGDEKKRLKSAFEEVKRERKEKFLEDFNKVKSEIDRVYKELCDDGKVLASLELDNVDEPYFGDISFLILSPTHGEEPIHEVSCKEKIMAALALVFSIQRFQRAPVAVLDNVEYLLGAIDILKLNKFLSKERRQMINITSDEESSVRADTLMRFGRNKENGKSNVVGLHHSRYIDDTSK